MKVSSSLLTRQKLLDVATDVFAEQGYKTATIRDIVRRAGVNQAAINYHFRSKEALYREVIDGSLCRVSFFKVHDNTGMQDTPENQVRVFMENMLLALSGKGNPDLKYIRLIAREISEPSGVLPQLMNHYQSVMDIVRSFFSMGTPEHRIAWAAFWVLGQGSVMMQADSLMRTLPPSLALSLAEHHAELPDFLSRLVVGGLKSTADGG